MSDSERIKELEEKVLTLKFLLNQRYGFAPGNYFIRCNTCGSEAIADKRASTCEKCANAKTADVLDEAMSYYRDRDHFVQLRLF